MNSSSLSRLLPWLVGAGIGLLMFSFIWPRIVGGLGYDDAAGEAYQQASVQYHSRITGHSSGGHDHTQTAHPAVEVTDEELAKAKRAFDEARARRDRALCRGQTSSRFARWLGTLCAIAAVIVWAVARAKGAG